MVSIVVVVVVDDVSSVVVVVVDVVVPRKLLVVDLSLMFLSSFAVTERSSRYRIVKMRIRFMLLWFASLLA